MKLTIHNLVRTRTLGESHVHNVIHASADKNVLLDLMDDLYEDILPAKAERLGLLFEGLDWLNDNRFEFMVYRMVDGVKTYAWSEVYEIVSSEVAVA